MQPLVDLGIALVVAIVFSRVLISLFNKQGPGPLSGFVFFVIILFLFVWAIGIWFLPFVPPLWGRYCVAFILVGAIFTLFLAAVIPTKSKEKVLDLQPPEQKRAAEVWRTAFGYKSYYF